MALTSEPEPHQSKIRTETLQSHSEEVQEVIDYVDGKPDKVFNLDVPHRELFFKHGPQDVIEAYSALLKERHLAKRQAVIKGNIDSRKNPEATSKTLNYKDFSAKEAGIEINSGRISFKVAGVQRDFRIRNDVIAKIEAITASKMPKKAKVLAIKKVVYTKLYQIIQKDGSIKSNKWRVGKGKYGTKEFTNSFNSSNKQLAAEIAKYAKIKIPKPVKAEPVASTPPPENPTPTATSPENPTPTAAPSPKPEKPENPAETSETTPENIKEILSKLNYKRISTLNTKNLTSYFNTLKEAVKNNQLKISEITKQIIPKDPRYGVAIAGTDKYRRKLAGKIQGNIPQHNGNAYGKRWQTVVDAAKKVGPNRFKHLAVFKEYMRAFGSKISSTTRAHIIENKDAIEQHRVWGSTVNIYFNKDQVKKSGEIYVGPSIVAHMGGLVIAAAGDWKGGKSKESYRSGGVSSPLSGNGVMILSKNGEYHYYSHFDNVDVKPGQMVKAGQKLGNFGSTGTRANAMRRIVHFEIHKPDPATKKIHGINGNEVMALM